MSINKRSYLGKQPVELGVKDAIHVAIVSLRAGKVLQPGEHIRLNEDREAMPSDPKNSFGIVDPFLNGTVARGQMFWGLMKMEEIPNVRHQWDHPEHSFDAPTVEVKKNKCLELYANQLGVTYEKLMEACQSKAQDDNPLKYDGTLSEEELDCAQDNLDSDLWYSWMDETGWEFPKGGTVCCPEDDLPGTTLFRF